MSNYSFADSESSVYFERIYRDSPDKQTLALIYKMESNLFNPCIIDTLIRLGECKEYNFLTLQEFSIILKCVFFRDFCQTSDAKTIQQYMRMLDVYFKAICKDQSKKHLVIKNRILAMLRLKITIPSVQDSIIINNANVSVRTSYVAREEQSITSILDIKNTIKDQFFHAVENAKEMEFRYVSHPSKIQLSGQVMRSIVSNMILLQEELINESASIGVKVEPFISSIRIPLTT